jgi:hypothetical protein
VAIFLQRTGTATLLFGWFTGHGYRIARAGDWMEYVPCQERDRIMLAFVLAVNAQNHVTSTLDTAVDDKERHQVLASMEAGRGHCHELRDRFLMHCEKHGC